MTRFGTAPAALRYHCTSQTSHVRVNARVFLPPVVSGPPSLSLAPSCSLFRATLCRCSGRFKQDWNNYRAVCSWGTHPRVCSLQPRTRQSVSSLHHSLVELPLELAWLPNCLFQSDLQLLMLNTSWSSPTFKIRSLSDVHTVTFSSYMTKAERKQRVYPLEQENQSDLEDPAALKWNV